MAVPTRSERAGIPGASTTTPRHDQIFVRRATGLVREGSVFDAAIYNLMWSGIPISLTLLFLFGAAFYADANLALSVVLAALLCLPIALTYALLASAMPRSGGDYVWVSRAVHPALGFMSNLSFNFWMLYFFGVYATLLGSWGMSALFRVLAAYTGQRGFLDAASFFVSEVGVFLLGCLLVIVMGSLFILNRGMETFFRVQRWGFGLWLGGGILLTTLALFVAGATGFVDRFNGYILALGGPAGAHAIALQAGGAPAIPATFAGSLLLVTIPYYTMGFIFQSAYFGGEIKRGRGTHLISMAGSMILAVVIMLAVVWVALATVGRDFLAALGLAPDPAAFGLDFVPLFPELGAIASGNLVIALLIMLGFIVGFVAWIPQTTILVSRGLFAWSFDRLIPEKVAEVNPRTNSPVFATVTIMALALVSVAILAFNPELSALVGLFGLTLTYLAVSVAGILFPYRMPDVFAASPYPGRVGGVPIVSIVSALSLVAAVVIAMILLRDPSSGTSWEFNQGTVLLALGVFAAGLPIYYLLRGIQRGRGVDVDLAYKEIPPD